MSYEEGTTNQVAERFALGELGHEDRELFDRIQQRARGPLKSNEKMPAKCRALNGSIFHFRVVLFRARPAGARRVPGRRTTGLELGCLRDGCAALRVLRCVDRAAAIAYTAAQVEER